MLAFANYYAFQPLAKKQGNQELTVHKYHVEFVPTVDDTAYDLRRKLIRSGRDAIREILGGSHFLFKNTMLLSNYLRVDQFSCNVEFEGQPYVIKVKWVATSGKSDPNIRVFYKAFVDKIVRSIKFMQIGSKYFDKSSQEQLSNHDITLLSGF